MRDYRDGLSVTIVIGDRKNANGVYAVGGPGSAHVAPAGETGGVGHWSGLGTTDYAGAWYQAVADASGAMNPKTQPEIFQRFSSAHHGGCHFLLGDGAVRFLNETINLSTYRNLANLIDGTPIGEF